MMSWGRLKSMAIAVSSKSEESNRLGY
jgi:hypothetical protein